MKCRKEKALFSKDVAQALGYNSPRDARARLVDEVDQNCVAFRDGTSGSPKTTLINEGGLYSLILGSKLEGTADLPRAKIAIATFAMTLSQISLILVLLLILVLVLLLILHLIPALPCPLTGRRSQPPMRPLPPLSPAPIPDLFPRSRTR